jgi:hypothetical protein
MDRDALPRTYVDEPVVISVRKRLPSGDVRLEEGHYEVSVDTRKCKDWTLGELEQLDGGYINHTERIEANAFFSKEQSATRYGVPSGAY